MPMGILNIICEKPYIPMIMPIMLEETCIVDMVFEKAHIHIGQTKTVQLLSVTNFSGNLIYFYP